MFYFLLTSCTTLYFTSYLHPGDLLFVCVCRTGILAAFVEFVIHFLLSFACSDEGRFYRRPRRSPSMSNTNSPTRRSFHAVLHSSSCNMYLLPVPLLATSLRFFSLCFVTLSLSLVLSSWGVWNDSMRVEWISFGHCFLIIFVFCLIKIL